MKSKSIGGFGGLPIGPEDTPVTPKATETILVKPGDILIIPTRLYIDRGEDDIRGGKATVKKVETDQYGYTWVSFKEVPDRLNLKWVLENQASWKKEYGKLGWARPDPDYG